MPSSTSIPIIVQGNSFSLAIPLQIYVISEGSMVLQDYTPDPTDQVSIQLKGSRRQYTYAPTVTGNTAFIDLSGNEMADNYGVVVSIVKENGQRLRSFRTDQFFIVESSDDLTTDDIIEGLENNVIYLNSQCFVAGEDGRGIDSIVKTSTSGLVDTYTITYTDATTSTFNVTNGAAGEAGATIASVEKTATVGKVDTYTITMTNGSTFDFEVTNGLDGVDLGLANIINDLTTGGSTNVLSAEQGKMLYENLMLIYDALSEGAFWNGKPTLTWVSGSTFQVINNLDGVVNSNTATSVQSGGTYNGTLTASGAFDVTITMGGIDVTSLVYNSSTGAISIASVTGNIIITAVADVTPAITIYDGYEISTDGSMVASTGKSCTDFIPMEACKLVWSAGVKGNTSNHFYISLYDASKNYIEFFNCNNGYRILDLTTHAQASNIAYVRITFATSKVSTRICYDITNGKYIFKGEDYDGRYDNFLWGKFNSPQSGATQDNILSSDEWAISDFVAIPANCGSVTNKVGSAVAGHKSTFYDANKVYKTYYDNSTDPRTITNASLGIDWVYEKISIYLDILDDCYIKDVTNNTYLFKGFNID